MKSANRVQETTTGTGTGALPLQGPTPRMRPVAGAGFANGSAFWGLIEHATALEWEISRCTVNAGAVTRDMVRDGSLGAGNLVPFSAGAKTISVIGPVLPLRTAVNDQDYAATVADRLIAFIALTAARTVTLPAAASFESGQILMIVDAAGQASQTNSISVAPNGTDTIAGSNAAQVIISAPHGSCCLSSNGAGGWDVLSNSLYPGAIDARLFGAKGDGVTDDTARLQAAIDATPAGGTLRLPANADFKCVSNLTRDGAAIRIVGSGIGSKITFGTAAGLIINATTGTDAFGLEDCMIRSGGSTNTLLTLSRINSQGSIRNVYFQGGGTHVWYERSVYNVLMSACTLYAAQGVALNLVPSVASTLNANGFESVFFVGNKRHVEISNLLVALGFRQCIFQRNSVIAGVQSGVFVHGGCWNIKFDGCGFEEINAIACVELGNCRYPSIEGGYFSMNGNGATAVDCSGSDGNAFALSMEGFSVSAASATNTLINLRSYGLRARICGLMYSGGTCTKGIGGTVAERDVDIDVYFDGTFTTKSDFKRRAGDLTAWWFGTGASPPVASAAFNMTVARSATGIYAASFGTAMENTAYVPVVSVRVAGNRSDIRVQASPAPSVNGFTFDVVDGSGSNIDASEIQIHVAGGLD